MTNKEKELTIDYLKNIQEVYIEGEGYDRYPLPEWYALDKAIELLEQTRWIPVSSGMLPEDYGEYICTMSDDNVQECGFVPSGIKELISGWSTCEADGFKKLDYRDIKAWMPLPEPYKKESEE